VKRHLISIVAAAVVLGSGGAAAATPPHHRIALSVLGTYHTGLFDEAAAEIVAHDPKTQRLFVVNAAAAEVQVLDIADPTVPQLAFTLRTAEAVGDPGAVANSVAVRRDGLVAVAVEAGTKTDPGWVVLYNARGKLRGVIPVGSLPDMLAFTLDGRTLLVANEGEPDGEFTFDPEGSVSVVDVASRRVRTAGFRAWDRGRKHLHPDVRIFGPDVTGRPDGRLDEPGRIARNLEPEYIVADDRRAYVLLQEANAVAVLDIRTARLVEIWPLGYKDHLLPGNELDVSDQDGTVRLANWPVYGVYQPDGIASYRWRGRTLLVTANEGDAREWGDYEEPARLRSLTDATPLYEDSPRLQAFLSDNDLGITTVDELRANTNLGRLNVTTATGLRADGSCHEDVYAFGGRSFSIWTTGGDQLYDSGADVERLTAAAYPDFFNASNTANGFENRSDDKGPEPEGVTIGAIAGRTYAFIGLERIGGVLVSDITDPRAPVHVQYLNHRDFTAEPGTREAGDLGPEGLLFIEAKHSPIGVPLLALANEVSGTTTLFRIDKAP
jgi:DNA-binding beta-propeller fold protein YncE